jgi:hypothetical protein
MDLEKFLNPPDKWDARYRQAVIAAIRKYQPERAEKIIQRYLSLERRAEFNMVNTYARRIFRRELLAASLDLETNLFRPGIVVMWATIADHDWACCDRNINFDYRAAKQKIRNAFTGMNFIGVIEPGYYPEIEWERDGQVGCLVSFHAHIVLWDTSESKLRRHQQRIRVRFLPVAPDDRSTPRFDKLEEPDDLRKVLRYSTKMPFEGYEKKTKAKGIEQINQEKEPSSSEEDDEEEEPDSVEQNDQAKEPKSGKQSDRELEPTSIEQSHLQLEAIHHYRLFKFMRTHSVFDAWLAGGEGAKLLRKARQGARKVARGT